MVRYVGVQGRGNVFRRVEERELLARGEVGLHAVAGERCRRREGAGASPWGTGQLYAAQK